MKKCFFLLLLIAVDVSVCAQTTLSYEYDKSGNCIKRKEVVPNQWPDNDSLSMQSQMVGNYKVILGPSPTTGLINGYVENYSGEGVVTAVNASNGQNKQKHFDSGNFSLDISNLPDGIYVMHLYISEFSINL